MKKTLLAVFVTTLIGVTSPIALAKGHGGGHGKGQDGDSMGVMQQLDLTDAQREEIKSIMRTYRGEGNKHGKDGKKRHGVEWTENADKMESRLAARQQELLENAKKQQQIYTVLTPAQREQWAQLKASKKADKMGKANGHREDHEVPPMFEELDLSDNQHSLIAMIHKKAMAKKDVERSVMQAFKVEERDVIQQTTFNEANWWAIADKYKPKLLAAMQAHADYHQQMIDLLTPEQAEQLNQELQAASMQGEVKSKGKGNGEGKGKGMGNGMGKGQGKGMY